jgi:predicted transcriptional regulator
MFLAQQVRSLRGDMSQEEFAKLLGTTQSVVSRFEDPSYGKFNLQTLLEIAAKLNRAVVARIVDFPTFLRFTEDMSESAMCPAGYDPELLDSAVNERAIAAGKSEASATLPHHQSVLGATPKQAWNQASGLLAQIQQSQLRIAVPAEKEQVALTATDHEETEVDIARLLSTGRAIVDAEFGRWSTGRGIVSH